MPLSPLQQGTPKQAYFTHLFTIGIAAFAGLASASSFARIVRIPVGHDQAWGLYAAEQTMRGVMLDGPHLLEVNPPFVIWFLSLPVAIAHALHLTLKCGFDVCLIAMLLLCIAWSAILFQRVYPRDTVALWAYVGLLTFTAGRPMAPHDVGQREHLLVYFLAPYLVSAAGRLRGLRLHFIESCSIGVFAGIACCLKPQHVIEVILLESLILFTTRSLKRWLSLEPLLCAGFVLSYLLAVQMFTPLYLHDLVPLLTQTYWGFDVPYAEIIRSVDGSIVVFLVACGAGVLMRRSLQLRALVLVYAVAALGALTAYVQQHKGWSYQRLSFQLFTAMLVVMIASDLLGNWLPRRSFVGFTSMSTAQAMLLAAVLGAYPIWQHTHTPPPDRIKEAAGIAFHDYPTGTPVGFLSIDPWQFPAITDQNKIFASRYMHLWMLPSLVREEDPADPDFGKHMTAAQLQDLSTTLRSTVAEDLAYWKPPVVAVDPCGMMKICQPLSRERYGSLLGWFAVDPAFQQQWSHYHLQRTIDGLEIYSRQSENEIIVSDARGGS